VYLASVTACGYQRGGRGLPFARAAGTGCAYGLRASRGVRVRCVGVSLGILGSPLYLKGSNVTIEALVVSFEHTHLQYTVQFRPLRARRWVVPYAQPCCTLQGGAISLKSPMKVTGPVTPTQMVGRLGESSLHCTH
jgi:hypothetical protein